MMNGRSGKGAEAGYGLVEVLVALAILGMAATGAIMAVSAGLERQARSAIQRDAWTALAYRMELGEEGQGEAELGKGRTVALWRIRAAERRTARLAGVLTEWVELEGQILWRWHGTEQSLDLQRVDARAIEGSP